MIMYKLFKSELTQIPLKIFYFDRSFKVNKADPNKIFVKKSSTTIYFRNEFRLDYFYPLNRASRQKIMRPKM